MSAATFIAGQQSVCFCALMILIVSCFIMDKRSEQSYSVILCAAVLTFGAVIPKKE